MAVWDVDDVFPSLEQTLQTMNDAQAVFGFELVDMSVPLDVWDLEHAPRERNFLWAERVARRLQGKAGGARRRRPRLRHAPLAARRRLAAISTAGGPDEQQAAGHRSSPSPASTSSQPKGPIPTARSPTRWSTCLAGFYGDLDTHSGGAKDCPLAFNQSRDFKHVVGPQKFDAACRRKLRQALGAKLGALEALLAVR